MSSAERQHARRSMRHVKSLQSNIDHRTAHSDQAARKMCVRPIRPEVQKKAPCMLGHAIAQRELRARLRCERRSELHCSRDAHGRRFTRALAAARVRLGPANTGAISTKNPSERARQWPRTAPAHRVTCGLWSTRRGSTRFCGYKKYIVLHNYGMPPLAL